MKIGLVSKRPIGGFTLIELLVVMSVIGMMSSIIIASVNYTRIKARNTNIVTTVYEFIKYLKVFNIERSRYPYSLVTPYPSPSPSVPITSCPGSLSCRICSNPVDSRWPPTELQGFYDVFPHVIPYLAPESFGGGSCLYYNGPSPSSGATNQNSYELVFSLYVLDIKDLTRINNQFRSALRLNMTGSPSEDEYPCEWTSVNPNIAMCYLQVVE